MRVVGLLASECCACGGQRVNLRCAGGGVSGLPRASPRADTASGSFGEPGGVGPGGLARSGRPWLAVKAPQIVVIDRTGACHGIIPDRASGGTSRWVAWI